MATEVKGQDTLDAANARKRTAKEKATSAPRAEDAGQPGLMVLHDHDAATILTMTKESGFEKPKTLHQLEVIVKDNAERGAGLWKKAATALLAIKTHKLWKKARDENDEPYVSFVEYAEARFGFRKTYAYDLVKAAQRKPEAISETSARAEMKAERASRPIDAEKATEQMSTAWDKFDNRISDLRDRVKDNDLFWDEFDQTRALMFETFEAFLNDERWIVLEAEADAEDGDEDDDDDDVDGDSATAENPDNDGDGEQG